MNTSDLQVRVVRKLSEALDISSFELVQDDERALPAFSAGSPIDVHLPNGLTRQYSLCNHPSEDHRYLIAVLRDAASRGGSQAMHELVEEGDVLHVSAPKNHFPLAHESRHSILLAGGIGVTPILCMAERLAVADASFELHCCTRSPERTAFRDRIAESSFASRVAFHHDDVPTIVEALAAVGVEIPTSCEQGVCGTCLTPILQGEPDHKDMYLTPEEQVPNDQFTPCCSRSTSALLVLDL